MRILIDFAEILSGKITSSKKEVSFHFHHQNESLHNLLASPEAHSFQGILSKKSCPSEETKME